METYSPEFAAYWLREPAAAGERAKTEPAAQESGLSLTQQVALEELAERVNAARCVI
jgi:hypothetical protein